MTILLDNLASVEQSAIAIQSKEGSMSYGTLLSKVNHFALWLIEQNINSLAVYAENSADWIIVDLACQQAKVIFTPIPLFFTSEQFANLVNTAKPALILSDRIVPAEKRLYNQREAKQGLSLKCYFSATISNTSLDSAVPKGTAKITFTSGSTGAPKGVCLSINHQFNVARSLADCIGLAKPRHLCLLPFPTLLENIAGVYAPLLAGGTVVIASDNERGFNGSRLINPAQLLACISKNQPDSLILVPELLQMLLHAIAQGWPVPRSLKFIAVGGSKVSSALIAKARALNLPIYQGYGLSECSSVVSLCSPQNDDFDSVGMLLPHLKAKIEDGELVVEGNTFLGYVGDKHSWYQTQTYTGDIAEIKHNTIYIKGRLKNIIINSFGRNIAPEWVESEVLSCGLFQQAVLIGDRKPFCLMIITPLNPATSKLLINKTLTAINNHLPDYAQIKAHIVLEHPMRFEDGLYTANGRPKRDAIYQHFETEINRLYANSNINKLPA